MAEQDGKRGYFQLFFERHTEQRKRHDDHPGEAF
jgi:hypothetical protein